MNINRVERCETCRFCEVTGDDAVCRRHAPSPVNLRILHSVGQNLKYRALEYGWPSVDVGFVDDMGTYCEGDWCGEWEPKKQ